MSIEAGSSYEPHPSDWSVLPVSDDDVRYVDLMDKRGVWDSVLSDRALKKIMPQQGSRITLVGRETGERSQYIGLFRAVEEQIHYSRRVGSASEANPGMVVSFEDIPNPAELSTFLDANSHAAGYMTGWSESGAVPYAILDGNAPDAVQFGAFDTVAATMTQASRAISNG